MKKILLTLAAIFIFGAAAADDRPVEYGQFPKAAKDFITKYFAKAEVTSSTLDNDGEYTAYLANGTKIEFNNSGIWKEVNCYTKAVPAGIIPAKIAHYVKANQAPAMIVKIDVDRNDYEVKLSTGVELKFDLRGNFIRIDD